MIKFHHTNKPEDCCGCRACEQICGKKAIAMTENEEGYLYPHINLSLCVNCGLCEKVCPMEHPEPLTSAEQEYLAAQAKDKELLKKSSSGAIFSLIAAHVLSQSGGVYGAAFSDNIELRHIRIDNVEGLALLRGSKYVQSDTNSVYSQIKANLKENKLVYFVGTPCQVQGLKLFLRKDYENLITSDLVCHGVPSRKIFKTVHDNLEYTIGGKMTDYRFRDKHVGGWSCSSSSSSYKNNENKQEYVIKNPQMDAYYNAFISGDIMRYSCYQCPFSNSHRVGDYTLADCWGIQRIDSQFKESYRYGVSMVILNSDNAKKIWTQIGSEANFEAIDKEWALNSNPQLKEPSPLGPNRERTYELAFSDYEKFISTYSKDTLCKRYKFLLAYYIRNNEFAYSVAKSIKKLFK